MTISSSSSSPPPSSREWLAVVFGLAVANIVYGAFGVLANALLERGLDPFFLVYSIMASIGLFLLPISFAFERGVWPKKFRLGLLLHLFLIAVGGPVIQLLMVMGMVKTSPAIASSMSNLSPAMLFVIACSIRLERLNMSCIYSKAKIAGTAVSLIGVLAMTFLQNPTDLPSSPSGQIDDWIIGCVFIFSSVFVTACVMLLQAVVLREHPVPALLATASTLTGSILTAAAQLIKEGRLDIGPLQVPALVVVCYIVVGGAISGLFIGFQLWALSKCGPVVASLFNPLATVTATILSAVMLGKFLDLGSFVGITVMFAGLYIMLWAKSKEQLSARRPSSEGRNGEDDVERPLLK